MHACPVCNINLATIHNIYGVLPCSECLDRRSAQTKPSRPVEITTEAIKGERKEYAKSIIQPYRSGELSKEYIDTYGTENIKASPQEIRKAKPVWGDVVSSNFNLKKSK